jgi:hypothetical protein
MLFKVPHAFQQRLSSEKTPSLALAIPAFEAMVMRWDALKNKYDYLANVIQPGIDKLKDYRRRIRGVRAYVLCMRT